MMKKLQNIAAIFAAGALLLGAASCSHDGGASLAALSDGGKKPPLEVTTPATAATYSFTGGANGIVAADLDGWSFATKDVISSPGDSALQTLELANGATIAWKSSSDGSLRFRAKHDAGSGDAATLAPTITALNYNGGVTNDISNGITPDEAGRYISIDVDGAGTVTANVAFKGVSSDKQPGSGGPLQAALVDEDGNLIGIAKSKEIDMDTEEATVSGKVTSAGTVYLVFSRNGTKTKEPKDSGGLDVTKITVTPAAE